MALKLKTIGLRSLKMIKIFSTNNYFFLKGREIKIII